ncbi:MAG: iron-containing alcohol dehydrogenase [Acidobacteriota bacterium]
MSFEFATAGRIVFGEGSVRGVAREAARFGKRVLVVTGHSEQRAARLLEELTASGAETAVFPTAGEPTVDLVRQGHGIGWNHKADVVIGYGGGSALDAGKAIAALLANGGDVLDYLEIVGDGKPLVRASTPFIAVPTTAGTGSEVTRNAVLSSPEQRVKASLRSPYMLPALAVVDPELTYDVPPAITAATGLDALTQLIEPYVSTRATPMTDLLALDGMRRVAGSLLRAFRSGRDREARRDMSLASLFGGIALANAGLGAVHGIASPLGGMFPAPHGAVCAALLPHAMAANIRALRARDPKGEGLVRYAAVAAALTGSPDAAAEDGAAWVAELCSSLRILPLRSFGVQDTEFPALVEKAGKANSMKANPIALTAGELTEILSRAL